MELKDQGAIVTGGGGGTTAIPTLDGGYLHYIVVNVNGPYVSYETRRITPPLWTILAYHLWKDLFYAVKSFFI